MDNAMRMKNLVTKGFDGPGLNEMEKLEYLDCIYELTPNAIAKELKTYEVTSTGKLILLDVPSLATIYKCLVAKRTNNMNDLQRQQLSDYLKMLDKVFAKELTLEYRD